MKITTTPKTVNGKLIILAIAQYKNDTFYSVGNTQTEAFNGIFEICARY